MSHVKAIYISMWRGACFLLFEDEESSQTKDNRFFKLSYSLQSLIDRFPSLTGVVWGSFIFQPLSEVI